MGPDPEPTAGPPRWVKVFGVISLVVALLFVVLLLAGGGGTAPVATAAERMAMSPGVRKFVLTAHVASSVGWLGAVASFLVLAVASLTSDDADLVRGAYLTMEVTGWYVLVPLSLASLVTGLVQSLGTRWGLFRHYWVLAKLLINVFATLALLLYTSMIGSLADVAADTAVSDAQLLQTTGPSAVIHAGGVLVLLLGATVLSVYKPPGMTRYGRRKQRINSALG